MDEEVKIIYIDSYFIAVDRDYDHLHVCSDLDDARNLKVKVIRDGHVAEILRYRMDLEMMT